MTEEFKLEKTPGPGQEKEKVKAISIKKNGEWETQFFGIISGEYGEAKKRLETELEAGTIEDLIFVDEK
jgi:hypothetical protein